MIYLDHNASSLLDPRVRDAFLRGLEEGWANPSSLHAPGRRSRALVEEARERVAALLGVAPGQVTFTSSGTEALNQALETVCCGPDPVPVVASAVEHPAVRGKLDQLQEQGRAQVREAPVDGDARLRLEAFAELLPGARLAALVAAQNEVGTVQPVEEAGAACAVARVPLLLDATQAVGRLDRDWGALPWDYLVLSGHKLRAPRGAAALVHRRLAPTPLPLVLGGGQERGRRAGTEAVASIVALGEACRLAAAGELFDPPGLRARREAFEAELLARVKGLTVLARGVERLPQTTAVCVPSRTSEALLAGLDLRGVCASSGSACSSGAALPSHVLAAMGVPAALARGRLRFSFGPETTSAQLSAAATALAEVCAAAS